MLFAAVHESAFGTTRTYQVALHMSAFGGVKRTCLFALQMSAYDPKRTLAGLELHPFC